MVVNLAQKPRELFQGILLFPSEVVHESLTVGNYCHQRVALIMATWMIRDLVNADLDGAIRIWEESGVNNKEPVFSIAEVVAAVTGGDPAVVAEIDGQIVGTACSILDNDRAWICRLALSSDWRNRGIGSELLAALEQRLTGVGVTRMTSLLHEGEIGDTAFLNQNFVGPMPLRFFDRRESYGASEAQIIHDLGGRLIPSSDWTRLSGGEGTHSLIERAIVLPLANPRVAERVGLRPPGAAILFGPPGTGKTSIARGIAGKLGWPFIEVFPAQLGVTAPDIAAGIQTTFDQLREVDHAVVFIDEVDEVASHRQEASAGQAITNALLKVIPSFRDRQGRLLICATNNVSRLDGAFLRTGRFDFVIPIGPPDRTGRIETLTRSLGEIMSEEIDLELVADQTEGFTVADLDHLVRTATQSSFERSLATESDTLLLQSDLDLALRISRPSVSADDAASFASDIETYARY